MSDHAWMGELAVRLGGVDGIVGVLLGGSRARGEHSPGSDYDLGLYYQPPLDTRALLALARAVSGPAAEVTEPGEWGPWVGGGGWLRIDGASVDWIYRDLDRVQAAWDDAQRGRFRFNAQIGHPFGVPDFAYVGEVALGIALHEPLGPPGGLTGSHAYLSSGSWRCLGRAIVGGGLPARRYAEIGSPRGLRLGRRLPVPGGSAVCTRLHGRARRWLINEKGAVTSAGRLPISPPEFSHRARHLLGHLGTTTAELANTLDRADELVSDTRSACRVAHQSTRARCTDFASPRLSSASAQQRQTQARADRPQHH
jgi:hypothetical protein